MDRRIERCHMKGAVSASLESFHQEFFSKAANNIVDKLLLKENPPPPCGGKKMKRHDKMCLFFPLNDGAR